MHNELDRRSFLASLAALGLGGAAAACARMPGTAGASASMAGRAMRPTIDRAGVQLYTVGDQMRTSFEGTLAEVAKIGYKNVEFAGYSGRTPEQVRQILDANGLGSPSSHIGLQALRTDLEGTIRTATTIGHKYITVPSLPRMETPMNSADTWKAVAAEFNKFGAALKERGLKIAFHNHSGEYVDVGGGKTGMDVFIAETDPDLVSFEMDLMWARVASQDPVAWFNRYPGRITMWHVKDMKDLAARQQWQAAQFRGERPSGQPAGQIAPVGAGDIDFKPIIAAWQRSGLEYYFVEHDQAQNWPGGSLQSLRESYAALQRLLA